MFTVKDMFLNLWSTLQVSYNCSLGKNLNSRNWGTKAFAFIPVPLSAQLLLFPTNMHPKTCFAEITLITAIQERTKNVKNAISMPPKFWWFQHKSLIAAYSQALLVLQTRCRTGEISLPPGSDMHSATAFPLHWRLKTKCLCIQTPHKA